MPYTYEWPRPSCTVDGVVFGFDPRLLQQSKALPPALNVLLVRRGDEPFKGKWALPGGFVQVADDGDQGEDLETAVRRELEEETAVKLAYLEQLQTFGTPGRDPRGRVISVAYFALVRAVDHHPVGGDDAAEAEWVTLRTRPKGLAFDHETILDVAIRRLQAKVRYAPIGFNLLPATFTLTELQTLYEAILMRGLDKRNFRKRILKMGILVPTGQVEAANHRPAATYRFDKRAYDKAVRDGFNFEI